MALKEMGKEIDEGADEAEEGAEVEASRRRRRRETGCVWRRGCAEFEGRLGVLQEVSLCSGMEDMMPMSLLLIGRDSLPVEFFGGNSRRMRELGNRFQSLRPIGSGFSPESTRPME